MSNLSQYRMTLAVFSLGLLWMVSEVVGDGEKPAPLDTATKSIVHRLAKSDEPGDSSTVPYELAVSQADDGSDEAKPGDDATMSPARRTSPFALDAGTGDSEDDPAAPATAPVPESETASPPDVGMIHK